MARVKEFRVLVASDGSLSAVAATVTAASFPWPEGTRTDGVVSRETRTNKEWSVLTKVLEEALHETAQAATRALVGRWPGVRVRVVDGPPAAAIVRAARRARADVVVMGWRGHGAFHRFLSGSVSRDVVRAAPCSVLVVRRAVRNLNTIVIGVDGSEPSARAVALASRLQPPKGGRIVLLSAVPLMSDATNPLMPAAIRRSAAAGVAAINRQRMAEARANLRQLATKPRAAGWRVDIAITHAAPLRSLMTAVGGGKADLLVVGVTGTSRIARLLLGSVAQGAMDRSPVPVLIVR